MTAKKIVLVDDEQDILSMLEYNLEKGGYNVHKANDGISGVELVKKVKPDLVLLDVMMPGMDGIEVCQTIRDIEEINQPVIAMLTSRAEDYSQIAGFDAGADDYITKPIRPRLLLSRIEALLRRSSFQSGSPKNGNQVHYIDKERFVLVNNGEDVLLPKKEFELIELLLSAPGKVFTRDRILDKVWGNDTVVGERTIDVHIRKLREKIGDQTIRTIKGVGYTYEKPAMA
ncbi:response regulator transcription factor [Lishizhenia sp.]|uniref:response regulator transcription factor n=1 Tax=Lishizhenia sp. TaxID=2497594 RepID=UPI00299E8074|nr:response regulator transcription factor [Lishizhenia sp.]MDX1445689.1 response regulator transcription factor [Lishizhenia sp.]